MDKQADNVVNFEDYRDWTQFKKLPTWRDPVLRRMNQLRGKAEAAFGERLIDRHEKNTIADLVDQMRQLYFEIQSFEKYITRLKD